MQAIFDLETNLKALDEFNEEDLKQMEGTLKRKRNPLLETEESLNL